MSIRVYFALALAVLVVACAPPEPGDEFVPDEDDAPTGDSLPDWKADGYGVPSSLALDRDGVVYLTFDDGPSTTRTGQVLDVLSDHAVQATFFVTGERIAGREDLLRRQRDEGHVVANHLWRHEVAGHDQFEPWVVRERETIQSVVGAMPLYFRFPYGASSAWREEILIEQGYVDGGVGWDVDSLDWDFGPDGHASRPEVPLELRDDFEGYVLSQIELRGGGVVLFHDIQSITAQHLDAILGRLEDQGYRFATLPTDRGTAGGGHFIGEPCASEADCWFEGALCEDRAGVSLCTRPCAWTCPDRDGFAITRCVVVDEEAEPRCAIQCDDGCAEGAECTEMVSPAGLERSVCWPAASDT